MKLTKFLGNSLLRFSKGFLLIHAIFFLAFFVIQACKKNDIVTNDQAADRLLTAVKQHSKALASIKVKEANQTLTSSSFNSMQVQQNGSIHRKLSEGSSNNEQIAHITFDEMPINPDFTYNINGMANLVTNYHGVLSYQPTNNSFSFTIPLDQVQNTLNPLITEARLYLNARGLSDSEIDEMIVQEGGQTVDLVPFATALAKYENTGNTTGMNYLSIFTTTAYAGEVGHCAMVALGVDALWALGGSNATNWTKTALKKAFGAVAKRFLGPIGVTIAVVSFGLCLGDWLP